MTFQGAKLAGASVIIAVDILDNKEPLARQFGATHFFNSTKLGDIPLSERIIPLLEGGSRFVDFAYEAVGDTSVLQTAASLVHPYWGVVVAVGLPNMATETKLPASTFAIGRTIKGKKERRQR